MKNKHLKEYIICYLLEEIETVTRQYIYLLNKYDAHEIKDLNSEVDKTFRIYEDKLLSFFNNILENEPLKDIEKSIEEWEKTKHSRQFNHRSAYEELIASYTILKETLTLLLSEYTLDFKKTHLIITDLEVLDHKIQECIIEKYRSVQMQTKKKY
jgi:hypothetical protein